MSHVAEMDVKQMLLSNAPLGVEEVQQLTRSVSNDMSNYRLVNEAVQELFARSDLSPAMRVRAGIGQFLLGRFTQASETLSTADGGAMAQFYLAKSRFAVGDYPRAIDAYQAAQKAGYSSDACVLGRAEALRYSSDVEGAMAALDSLSGAVEQSADYLYQRGATVSANRGSSEEVAALYERAVKADPTHAGALFGLAMENDRRGNDETALDLYQRSAQRFPSHIGALLNLGLMYEDREQYDRARQCYLRILDVYPHEPRATLFLKDAKASGEMVLDEDEKRRQDRLKQVLSVPVTDFELSVRSRNCLQKMGIMTLGDLTRTSEQELLASKNFGETSLVEIKEMMASKGLDLGQFATERPQAEAAFEAATLSADEQAMLNKPISDLNLSVRARKCMIRLGVSSVGELIRRTGDELLECKNFGVTSLNEVREKLTAMGLKLRGE